MDELVFPSIKHHLSKAISIRLELILTTDENWGKFFDSKPFPNKFNWNYFTGLLMELNYHYMEQLSIVTYFHSQSIGSCIRFYAAISHLIKYPKDPFPLRWRYTSIKNLTSNSGNWDKQRSIASDKIHWNSFYLYRKLQIEVELLSSITITQQPPVCLLNPKYTLRSMDNLIFQIMRSQHVLKYQHVKHLKQ